MKIAIIGYGKMGKEIELAATQSGHQISMIIDLIHSEDINKLNKENTDIVIEFTNPDSVLNNILYCFSLGIPIVTGTTGWHSYLETVSKNCKENNGTIFYSPNFSIGVKLYMETAKISSNIFNNFPEYKISIEETHHTQKIDSPSGTAISLANNIIPELSYYTKWNKAEESKDKDLPIFSYRIEETTGVHNLIFESETDKIEIKHTAKSRKGFAHGAILAAEFIIGKKGIFTMHDLYKNINK
ncbi:MAG: 4-hydroxy-tetrahydrodipicolinate reductase [Bacteroidia bacterium]|nr:4-hydroxy-tetrahydrodipicolinate reductase [Bacteroidia bacterium]